MRRLAALLLLAASPALGESGLTGGETLQRTLGARAAAMGRAFVSIPGEPDGLWYNPAGTAFLETPAAATTYLSGLAGGGHGLMTYVQPEGKIAYSGSLLYFNAGTIELNLSNGTQGPVTAQEATETARVAIEVVIIPLVSMPTTMSRRESGVRK